MTVADREPVVGVNISSALTMSVLAPYARHRSQFGLVNTAGRMNDIATISVPSTGRSESIAGMNIQDRMALVTAPVSAGTSWTVRMLDGIPNLSIVTSTITTPDVVAV
jgi:hypothetical protein